ncbi:hypothetical protein DOTSEDRAFT_73533 [Dothistroma septosporum NZE10]|uniref:Versicolorin reductase 1 n=1 Tax=Dothistroma septosporum (strain NZE10 / CBS 128990) TaxID=675120 RepID=N1PKZ7_DOTSN|nr:hypothetical protein DOTSEDRAFT_73533 [Dothistroma septosporum NZE10]
MTDSRLAGRIAIITGGSSGLGKATALRFARSGARIVVADLASSGVEQEIQTQYGKESATFVKVDVTQESDIQNLVQEAVNFGGRIDILLNYAGVGLEANYKSPVRLHEARVEDFDKTWAINVRGEWLCNKYVVAQMLKQEPQPPNARGERTKGRIVNVASTYGLIGGRGVPMYVPSKHAVVGMTKQMAADYATERIHVNCLCPAYTKTPMIEETISNEQMHAALVSMHPWQALGEASDVADAALFLASDEAAWITGQCLAIDGGLTAV